MSAKFKIKKTRYNRYIVLEKWFGIWWDTPVKYPSLECAEEYINTLVRLRIEHDNIKKELYYYDKNGSRYTPGVGCEL